MSTEALKDEIGKLLRGLRACDTQAQAVEWMKRAYTAMEQCLPHLDAPPEPMRIFVPERPRLEVVQSVSAFNLAEAKARREELRSRSLAQTVVYPSVFLPPGLKPLPKAWTRSDTLRLENAAKAKRPALQRRGR